MNITSARAVTLYLCLACLPALRAQCPVHSIAVKGRVEHAPREASVRVVLVYPPDTHKKQPPGTDMENNDRTGETAEAVLDGDSFTIPVEFLTNDRRTALTFAVECGRKPRTVIVTLKGIDRSGNIQEDDRVTLDFPRDFKSDDTHHYALRSELVLSGEGR